MFPQIEQKQENKIKDLPVKYLSLKWPKINKLIKQPIW